MSHDPVMHDLARYLDQQAREDHKSECREHAQREADDWNANSREEYRKGMLTLPEEFCGMFTEWLEQSVGNRLMLGMALLDVLVRNDNTHLALIAENLLRDDAAQNADKVCADEILDEHRKEASEARHEDWMLDRAYDGLEDCLNGRR